MPYHFIKIHLTEEKNKIVSSLSLSLSPRIVWELKGEMNINALKSFVNIFNFIYIYYLYKNCE